MGNATFTAIDGTENVYDSRDILERLEWLRDVEERTEDESHELQGLEALNDECESVADWGHGECLIARDCFVGYIKDLIHDCYEMPKAEGWPFRHMQMDYQAAADEAEQDYRSVYLFGNEYLIRC